jgi:hypothetical protein
MRSEELTCDGCLKPINENAFVLTNIEIDGRLHPIRLAHGSCLKRVESAFREEGLTIKTRIAEAHFLSTF